MNSRAETRSRIIQRVVVAACLAIPILAIGAIASVIISAQRAVEWSNQMYARQQMSYLLVDYLQDNDNQWPASWEHLEDRFPDFPMGGYSYDEIRTMLCIDFSASKDFNCDHLNEIRSGKIKLVWSCSGDDSHYEDGEPNQIIADYLEHICSQKDTTERHQ